MKLKVLLPTGVLLDEEVTRASLEDVDGAMTLLGGHIDIATEIVPGVMSFQTAGDREATARTALNKIEATFVHRFIELEHGR